jgi:ribA/ribD-fused uncharacterized protein
MITKFDGRYSFLSNFYPCKIDYQGIVYKSVEAFYVAMKVNNDQMIDGRYYTAGDFRELISKIESPGKVKRIGKVIRVRSDWEDKKLEFMNWAVREKFKDEHLKEMLLSTGNVDLIEGNWWHDIFWGQCTCEKCAGKGKNHLGKILMKVRDELSGNIKPNLYDVLFKNKKA